MLKCTSKSFIFLVIFLISVSSHGQLKFTMKLKTMSNGLVRGKLEFINNDSISLIGSRHLVHRYHFSEIQSVNYRHANSSSTGALIGGATGFIIGGISAVSSGGNCSTGSFCIEFDPAVEFFGGGVIVGMAGAMIGGVAGLAKIPFEIKGDGEEWKRFIKQLETRNAKYKRHANDKDANGK